MSYFLKLLTCLKDIRKKLYNTYMLKNKLIVSNWKMNLDFIDTKNLLSKLIKISKKKSKCD